MGSLMAGWDSPTKNPQYEKLMRNKSFTKDGIEEYWKLRKNTQEQHLSAISPENSKVGLKSEELSNKEYTRSNSLPIIDTKGGTLTLKPTKEADINVEDLLINNRWWTKSNWAFLNERPVIESEVPKYKYASQYHVTNFTPVKHHQTSISDPVTN